MPVMELHELKGHARIDARSLAMYRAVAEKLRKLPELLAIAHDNLQRWSETAGRSQSYLDAWRELLKLSLEELFAAICRPEEPLPRLI